MNSNHKDFYRPFSLTRKALRNTPRADSGLSKEERVQKTSHWRQSVASWELRLKLKRLAGKKRSRDEVDEGEASTRPRQKARTEDAPKIVLPVLNEPTFEVDLARNAVRKPSRALAEEYEASCGEFVSVVRVCIIVLS